MQIINTEKRKKMMKALGEIIKFHRLASKKNNSIYKVSAESFISKSTWREAELGICKDINLTTLWRIADGLELSASDLLLELSEKLGDDFTLSDFE